MSQRAIRSDSATVWSPPLNVGNCINQHISPKAESISSTARLLAIIRPPAMIVLLPVFSHQPHRAREGCAQCYDVWAEPQYLGGLEQVYTGRLWSGAPPFSSHPRALSCSTRGRPSRTGSFYSASPSPLPLLHPLQITCFWPLEAAHTGDGPHLGGRTRRKISVGLGSRHLGRDPEELQRGLGG